jgi:hypothetical protein
MKNLNEWLDYCDYIKTTTNLDVLRTILFSSLTIGIPKYVFELKNDVLTFKKVNQEDLDAYINKIEYSEIKQYRNKSLASTSSIKVTSPKFGNKSKSSFQKKSVDLSLLQQMQSRASATVSTMSRNQNKDEDELLDMSNFYEPFVDNLLDLTDLVDFSDSEYGDSQNLLFINRTLLFDDLMKHLDDKYFQENYSFLLFQIINSIVTKVNFKL